ncbi:MAG TPA: hypothetical protein VNU44_15845 [Bryobacteraceae bacterium]|jgi:hypothetical protein|nr:hypothetical protein [Bryobacteraceae bacterium]
MAIISRQVIRIIAAGLCFPGFAASESLLQELQRRADKEGLALLHIHGSPVMILRSNGEWITEGNPRELSSAWLSNGGAAVVWSVHYPLQHSPWSCASPLIIESPGNLGNWTLPGEVINATAGVSPDGKSVAFYGTYKPPGSGTLNTMENRSKWVNGLMFASRGTSVNAVFTNPMPKMPDYLVSSISWSPDGSAFAYDYQGKIYVFDVAGKAPRVVASGSTPNWSPDGHWIAFRTAEGMASAVETSTGRGRDLFGRRQILAGVHWSPDSRYVMLSERLGFLSNLLHLRSPLWEGVMLVIRVEDGESVPINWIGLDSFYDNGFDWVSDYRAFMNQAAIKPIVQSCQ